MDLFEYMRETISARIQTAADDAGRSGWTAAYYREGQTVIPCDQGGQTELGDFLRPARNGENDARESDCKYDKRRIYADQCHSGREKGYGRSCK